jgi:Fe-S cluster assembly protein SufD
MSIVFAEGTAPLTVEGIGRHASKTSEPVYLTERRIKALKHYLETPMPGRRDEIWRRVEFGDLNVDLATVRGPADGLSVLSSLSNEARSRNVFWGTPEQAAKEQLPILEKYWNTTVFPAGQEDRFGNGGKFHALNQALWEGGYVFHVPQGVEVELPMQARFFTRSGSDGVFPHNLIVVEEGASATVIESYESKEEQYNDKSFVCPQTEIILGRGAKLRYILLQNIGPNAVIIGAHRAHQYADSRLTYVSAHLGSRLAKTFISTIMLEPRAHAYLSGLYYGTGSQKIHLDTYQHHISPECTTDLMFKGALDQTARAVYRGMIRLEPGAQKTDAYQQNRTLLLSDDARVDSIPGLEILANDVRCTHGATAGQIDPTILFYLMSRGLTEFQAKKMIMDGFFEEVILRFGLESVTEPLRREIDGKIAHQITKTVGT